MNDSTTTPQNARTKQTRAARPDGAEFVGQDADNAAAEGYTPAPGPARKAPIPPGFNQTPVSSGSAADLALTLGEELVDLYGEAAVFARGSMWGYDAGRGLWAPIPRAVLYARLAAWEGRPVGEADPETGKVKRLRVNNVKTPVEILEAASCAESHRPDLYPRGFFPGRRGLAFADKFLALEGRQLVPLDHSAEHRATHGYTFPLPRRAAALDNAPAFRSYLDSLFAGAPDAAERKALLGEWFGLALLGVATKFNKALLLHGPGGSGKGTFLRIMQAVFPEGSVTAIQPQQWTHGPSLAEMAGARLNAVNEIDASDLRDVGRFKAVISGDRLEGERKFRDPFTFAPEAGHVFTANPGEVPAVPRADKAFWDRWACVPFDNVFRGKAEEDRDMAERIIAEELPAVVQWLVASAARALEANRLTTCPSGEAVLGQWSRETCSVMLWVYEETGPWTGRSYRQDAPTTTAAYEGYRQFCARSGFAPATITSFTRRIKAHNPDFVMNSNGARLKREWPWVSKPRDADDGPSPS